MESSAKLSSIRLSPRKTRLVVDLVRGKAIQTALNTLRFSPQPSAKLIAKRITRYPRYKGIAAHRPGHEKATPD